MKKLVSVLLATVVCLGLGACGKAEPELGSTAADPTVLTTEATATASSADTEVTSEATTEATTTESESAASSDTEIEARENIALFPGDPDAWEDVQWVSIEIAYYDGMPPKTCLFTDSETVSELVKYFTAPELASDGSWVRGPSNGVVEFSNGFKADIVYDYFTPGNELLSHCVRVFDAEDNPVYFTLSDSGKEFVKTLILNN